jgi:methylphosphotriester-DNA--protein-cysteine methyltransferase
MQLAKSDLKQFKLLYQKHFGIELDNKQAQRKLALLVRQLEVTYRPITKVQAEKYGNGNRNEKLVSKK